jgi:subtilisin family serine protease
MRRSRLLAAATSGVLLLGVLQAASSAAAAAPKRTTPSSDSVTLITGDRVVTHGQAVSVEPGPGRAKVRFLGQTVKAHRYVLPSDALPLLKAGRLDKQLFDVTELASLHSGRVLPLLLTYGKSGASAARSLATAGDARVTRDIPAVRTLAVKADIAGRSAIWTSLTSAGFAAKPDVQKVWLDGKRRVSDDKSGPQIGAPTAWQAGYDGTGVTVGVLDTGIDATHPDFAGQIKGSQNFTETPSVDDEVGHGTHVASIIAGTGAASNGRYRGIAPGAKLLIGKVCDTEFCDDSSILAGMAWAAPQASVINISIGGPDSPGNDPLEQAVDDLTAQYGTLFVIAAGNDGATGTVESPGTADAALSVGAVDADNQLADFTSRGPRAGDYALKPDITAPGVDIVAAKAAHGFIGDPAPVDGYVTLSGTSMATPHVAGAAAILAQEHPAWSSTLRKDTLMGSAQPTADVSPFDQGSGRVDIAREITQTISVDEGSISFGLQEWPHGDDQPVTKTVTYRNSGAAAVDLTLTGPGGAFSLSSSRLSVPAGGTASITVTADTRGDSPDGLLGGYLTAVAASGVRVETALGIDKEVESYDVSVRVTGLDGAPAADSLVALLNLDTFQEYDNGGRVPAGRYGVFAWIFGSDESSVMLTDSELVVDHALTVDADARKAGRVVLTAPQKDAAVALAAVNADWTLPDFSFSASLLAFDFSGLYVGRLSSVSKPFFSGSVSGSFADPAMTDSPYTVDLAYLSPGRMFTGLRKSPRISDLAALHTSYATEATGAEGVKGHFATGSGWATLLPFHLPFQRTEYLNTETSWNSEFDQQLPPVGDDFPALLSVDSHLDTYRAGHSYTQQWNRAVFGPTLREPSFEGDWVTRQGDHLIADVPLFGEGNGYPGFSTVDTNSVALYRGSTKLGEGVEYDLPPGVATYRLEASATRSAPHTLSTSVSGVWTFRSGHVGGTGFQRLPLSAVSFAPRLDAANSAPAGRWFDVPVTVTHQPGAAASSLRSLRVESSSDDGKTWQKADVHRSVARVHNPAAGFVSLRVTATDNRGGSVTETVIRAYAIR